MKFKLHSEFSPTGDQPEAINQLKAGVMNGDKFQVLLGVTGSGKTFTIANLINELNRPTLILSHNKTLAAQLYGEFKQFFPENAVEYFVSYYDYYQPEAYLPSSDTYIEKDLQINDEIEKLRLSATSALMSGRRDVIVVSSVSCIYGIGNPVEFKNSVIQIVKGQIVSRNQLLHQFVSILYSRTDIDFKRGTFRVKGDTVDIFPAYSDISYRIMFWDDEIEEISSMDPVNGHIIEKFDSINIYPANIFVTGKDSIQQAINEIQDDMVIQTEYFKSIDKPLEAKRLEDKVTYDLEMLRELGYCSGIENYSRYFDRRKPGTRPFCLIDYFPEDYLFVIDESHVTVSQVKAMYGGDRSRKVNLVDYGFRLPSAMDNRPLKFDEFENVMGQTIFVSATPADYELTLTEGVVVEQVIRPTGLIDPIIVIKPCQNQVDDLIQEIKLVVKNNERVLITTLTKRMAEELDKYLAKLSYRSRYIHSDVDTLERVEIMRDLRLGLFDVLVGVNLLREGLDLPEVSLVAIMDADKEGFLRSARSLTQTAGRAARNINGKVIMYADKITESMKKTIDETNRRREKQMAYNKKNNITPTQITKSINQIMTQTSVADSKIGISEKYFNLNSTHKLEEPKFEYLSKNQLEKMIRKTRKEMEIASKELDFMKAAQYRDELLELQERLKNIE